jgi:transcriptional regulator with XRE-family HTH domain
MTGPRAPQDGDDAPGVTPEGEAEPSLSSSLPPEAADLPSADQAGADQFSDVSLGQLFREVRQNRALTLAEVERDTRINRDYLEALEQERYELLPAPVYTRGFVRAYARHLGLDEEGALSLLPADLPAPIGLQPIGGLRGGSRASLRSLNLPLLSVVGGVLGLLAIVVFSLVWLRGSGPEAVDTPGAPTATASAAPSSGGASGTPTGIGVQSVATVPPFELGQTPNFIGVDSETAQALLTQLGLRFVVIEVDTSDAPAGSVFAQTPEPGAPIDGDGDVTLIVSKGSGG